MPDIPLHHLNRTVWSEVCKKVNSSVVFIEHSLMECLHWNGGLLLLLNAQAQDIREFNVNESGSPSNKKAVFLLSSCILGETLDTLRTIVESSSFQHCVVITNGSVGVHCQARSSESNWFHQMEDYLQEWMGNQQYVAEVLHYPLFLCTIGEKFFITPTFSKLFPFTEYELQRLMLLQRTQQKLPDSKPIHSLSDVDYTSLPYNLQLQITHFVGCFHHLLTSLDMKEDIITLGHLSRIVGSELENMQAARKRRKTASTKVTLLLVDRTLDLATASSHIDSTVMDKIQAILPKLPGHTIDVAVNVASIVSKSYNSQSLSDTSTHILPGCLSHPENPEAINLLEYILLNKPKDTLNEMHRVLASSANKKATRTRITSPDTIEKLVHGFCGDIAYLKDHSGVLELCLAAVQSLKNHQVQKLEQLLGIEKVLLQNLSIDGASSVLNQFVQLVLTRHDRNLPLEDIIVLLIHVYSLAGKGMTNQRADEEKLKNVIAEALVGDKETVNEDIVAFVGGPIDEMTAHLAVEKLFEKLQAICIARDGFKKYKSLYESYGDTKPASSTGLLEQLINDIMDPQKPELIDVEYHSSGLKDMFKSGLGLFMNVQKPHPTDGQLVILFVIGGITAHEIAKINDLTRNTKLQFLVGSNRLLTPRDLISDYLTNDSLLEC